MYFSTVPDVDTFTSTTTSALSDPKYILKHGLSDNEKYRLRCMFVVGSQDECYYLVNYLPSKVVGAVVPGL